jgi:phage gpG-like protein
VGVGFEIEFKFPDWATKLKAAEDEIALTLAASIQTNRGLIFDHEGAYNGHKKWAPLKFRDGQILSNRGKLRKSMAPTPSRGQPGPGGIVEKNWPVISVSTTLLYARMMNNGTVGLPGGVLRPVKAKALRIPTGKTGFIFRKSVRIPGRPFDEVNDADVQEFEEVLRNKIEQILNG